MARRFLVLYLALVIGPLLVFAAAFAVRDLIAGRKAAPPHGNGHAETEGLEHTVEEVRAPQ